MSLDYSQKRLVSAPFRRKGKGSQRLRLYAFLTGLLSTLVSLATVIVTLEK
ncbi:MAG: hypothetical protein WDN10_01410 [bacterium]